MPQHNPFASDPMTSRGNAPDLTDRPNVHAGQGEVIVHHPFQMAERLKAEQVTAQSAGPQAAVQPKAEAKAEPEKG